MQARMYPLKYGPNQERGTKQGWNRGKVGGSWPRSAVVCWQAVGEADSDFSATLPPFFQMYSGAKEG